MKTPTVDLYKGAGCVVYKVNNLIRTLQRQKDYQRTLAGYINLNRNFTYLIKSF